MKLMFCRRIPGFMKINGLKLAWNIKTTLQITDHYWLKSIELHLDRLLEFQEQEISISF